MKHFATTIIVLLSVVIITGCRKTSREIIWYGGNPDSAYIVITNVQTTKDTDRDGDYYKDVFSIMNKQDAKFVSAENDASFDIGMVSDIIYEPTTAGERLTVLRRKKNVTYTLRTTWNVPGKPALYEHSYKFTSTGE